MKTKKIEFVGEMRFDYSSNRKKVDDLLLKLINDNDIEFQNYSIESNNIKNFTQT